MNSLPATIKTHQIRYSALLWALIKLLVSGAIVWYFEYGIYVVLGYLLYSLEKAAGFQYLNSQETNFALNEFNQALNNQVVSQNYKIEELESKIFELEQLIADMETEPDSSYE